MPISGTEQWRRFPSHELYVFLCGSSFTHELLLLFNDVNVVILKLVRGNVYLVTSQQQYEYIELWNGFPSPAAYVSSGRIPTARFPRGQKGVTDMWSERYGLDSQQDSRYSGLVSSGCILYLAVVQMNNK